VIVVSTPSMKPNQSPSGSTSPEGVHPEPEATGAAGGEVVVVVGASVVAVVSEVAVVAASVVVEEEVVDDDVVLSTDSGSPRIASHWLHSPADR
jgi:hypothetical protein